MYVLFAFAFALTNGSTMPFSPGVKLLKGRNSNISNVWGEKNLQKYVTRFYFSQ